jgi:hypothetical protein
MYPTVLDMIANDCNMTDVPMASEECDAYDLILGDYYVNDERALLHYAEKAGRLCIS